MPDGIRKKPECKTYPVVFCSHPQSLFLLNLDGIVDDEVHELVESLLLVSLGALSSDLQFPPPLIYRRAYSNLSLDSDRQLLVQPDLNRRVLLQQLEDEVDRWEKDSASTTSAWTSGHILQCI